MTDRYLKSRPLLLAGAALIALHVWHDVFGLDSPAVDRAFAEWWMPVAFLGAGLVTLRCAKRMVHERLPWALLGAGLVLYAAGSVYYSAASALADPPSLPSPADFLWLSLYPIAFAAIALLARSRFSGLGRAAWLDGAIAGLVVAALAAALVFEPVFDATAGTAAGMARFAYPLGDLICVGFVVTVWSIGGRRTPALWGPLGLGFALLAGADSLYVVQAAHGTWNQGAAYNIAYGVGTMLMARAAWIASRRFTRLRVDTDSTRLGLPVICGATALALAGYAAFVDLNPLATGLALATLLAVILRLGVTLRRLNRQRSALEVIAATDPLTGLANHRALHERLADELRRSWAQGAPLSVVALDLDHFKSINDTYGHNEGDVALQAVAAELARQLRPTDLVGRVGGEEFVLVLPRTTSDEAVAIAERCRAAVAALHVQGDALACSAGVATHPDDDAAGGRLLELADGALYWAKHSGRDQTRRYDPHEVVLLSSTEQTAQVRDVLTRDDTLNVVFQPIVELATGRVAGYEALTRFRVDGPNRAPDLWFAQARRCGLGPQLEAKALETALAVPGRPNGTFLSLNVSPASLVSREIAAVLPEDLSDIVIELTEDEMFSKDEALDRALAALRARGARIAVDDAGSGYAGLQQLVRIKPEILKLDRSLVRGVDADPSKAALLESLARFASSTGAAVCGEGVETVEEMRALTRVDTTYAQGYALARPAAPWATTTAAMAAEVSDKVTVGMRLASGDRAIGLGEVSDALARVHSLDQLVPALASINEMLHTDDVAVSRVLAGRRMVETVTNHNWLEAGEVFSYDDYPTTEHVVTSQVIGQVIDGDPAADAAEVGLLRAAGFRALLMAPVVFRGETVGLLELCRHAAQPWTALEIDQARVLANHLGAVIHTLEAELPWSPRTVVSASPKAGIERQGQSEGEESG